MTTGLTFTVMIRGNVTPEQFHRLQTGDPAAIGEMEALFRDRLNAHFVTIQEVTRTAEGSTHTNG